jgi:sirohydrochlorin ferrochelatase
MKTILLISHGSHSPRTKEEVIALLNKLKGKIAADILTYAFLEIEKPSIPEAIARSVKDGAGEVVLLLNFLNAGKHVDTDIPAIVEQAKQQYPDVRFTITKPVGQHEGVVDLFCDLLR